MSLPKCQHNVSAGDGRFEGQWNAPFSRCSCCGVMFPYIDSFSMGSVDWKSRTWFPKDRCPQCGGEYSDAEGKFPVRQTEKGG